MTPRGRAPEFSSLETLAPMWPPSCTCTHTTPHFRRTNMLNVSDLTRTQSQPARRTDASAARALAELDRLPGTISGARMIQAITEGTADHDAQAAGREHAAFAAWAKENPSRLS